MILFVALQFAWRSVHRHLPTILPLENWCNGQGCQIWLQRRVSWKWPFWSSKRSPIIGMCHLAFKKTSLTVVERSFKKTPGNWINFGVVPPRKKKRSARLGVRGDGKFAGFWGPAGLKFLGSPDLTRDVKASHFCFVHTKKNQCNEHTQRDAVFLAKWKRTYHCQPESRVRATVPNFPFQIKMSCFWTKVSNRNILREFYWSTFPLGVFCPTGCVAVLKLFGLGAPWPANFPAFIASALAIPMCCTGNLGHMNEWWWLWRWENEGCVEVTLCF